ncbi:unnamed protein product [Phytomonas sp. Hart1]|nr:unnamed protein product [Phytomonas sp. Hart1]|eukprot:CCW69108.1 unnamed protein product [Phytomonas sp. isolate Hart1]
MFFSTYVLTKKGPLAKVWLAAHWDKRLTRNEVKVVDLGQTIMHIVRPVVPIALRTSGELLVGVVRIYALKVKYLLKEATEATIFLRVTTSNTLKEAAATGGAACTLSMAVEKAAAANGMLVNPKGDMETVPLAWGKEMLTKYGSFSEAADAFGKGRFDAIADLLGAQHVEGLHKGDGLLASVWYTVEPTSQISDGPHGSQQDYDEIAKMRADLMTFHERASDSSASKSKSSLSSIEKGRGSAAAAVDAAKGERAIPYPPLTDELDIGIPLPDEAPGELYHALGSQVPGYVPEDLFTLPTMADTEEAAASGPTTARVAIKKARPANILDLAATTLPREAFEMFMSDRSGVLNKTYRRGPLDAQEQHERYLVANLPNPEDPVLASSTPITDSLPIADITMKSIQSNPSLRAAFTSALHPDTLKAIEEAMRALQTGPGHGVDPMARGPALPEINDEIIPSTSPEANAYKRARQSDEPDDGTDDSTSLSASAVRTLKRIRDEVSSLSSPQPPAKRPRVASPESTMGGSCTLKSVCNGLGKRDAARMFVDLLVLASRQLLDAHQEVNSSDIKITLKEASAAVVAA